MKKLLLSLALVASVLVSFAQSGSKSYSGVFTRVNDSTTYIAAAATKHAQGYADIFFNNQAVQPHLDVWNGSSYDHVFDFNAGGVGDVTYADLMTSRTLTGADDLDQSDNLRIVYANSGTPFNITVDLLSAGTQVTVINKGLATVTLVEGSGVTLTGTTISIEPGENAIIIYETPATPDVYVGAVTSVDISGGSTGLTFSGGPITSSGTMTMTGTLLPANGGTGITSLGSGVATWLGTPSWSNFNNAITGTSPFWSSSNGVILTGVNNITTNTENQLNVTGTIAASATGKYIANFGGQFTSFSGTGQNIGYLFNSTMVGNGTGSTQVGTKINHSFSGGTSPINVHLQVGNVTPILGYDFQAFTGYFSGNLRLEASLADNRGNNILQQSASGVTGSRTLTLGNATYSLADFAIAGTLRTTQSALSSVALIPAFQVTGGAHTGGTAATEATDIYFNLARTVQRAAGAVTTDRIVRITAPTLSFTGSSTITNANTVSISGEPIAGTNATITNGYALTLESGDFNIASAGGGIYIKEGSNATMGSATLTAGTVTINTTKVTSNSRIYLTSQVDGGTVGFLRVSGRTAATSFTITSSSATDTSTVAWVIVEPTP